MGNYLLKLNTSLKGEFNSDSDSLVDLDPFLHKNKANYLKKSGKTKGKKAYKHHKFDALLYNIKNTDYIINNQKRLVEYNFNKGELPVLLTGGDLITTQGRGKTLFKVKAKADKGYYITFTL